MTKRNETVQCFVQGKCRAFGEPVGGTRCCVFHTFPTLSPRNGVISPVACLFNIHRSLTKCRMSQFCVRAQCAMCIVHTCIQRAVIGPSSTTRAELQRLPEGKTTFVRQHFIHILTTIEWQQSAYRVKQQPFEGQPTPCSGAGERRHNIKLSHGNM